MKHKILVLVLAMLLVVCAAAQFAMPTAALAAELPTFGTTTSTDGYNMWTGKPTGFSGRATVNLYFASDTFPGEPRYKSSDNYTVNYIRYDNTFAKNNSGYFVVNEILQDNFRNTSDFVLGSNLTFLLVWSATSGIFDPSGVDRYFTDDFKQALEFYENQMISDVLAAKLADGHVVSNTNIDDYEVVWYVIKYQRIGETWYVNGLIREKDKYSVTYNGNGNTAGSPPDGRVNMSYTEAKNYYIASHISTDDSGEDTSLARDNYTFTGWNTKPDGTGVFFEAEKHADLTGLTDTNGEPLTAIVLYAQWKQDSKYTVTWLNDDDSIIHLDANLSKNVSVTYDGATPNKAPDSEHIYVFDGWATSKNGTNLGITPTVTVKNDMTMYPLFRAEERTYTVTWVNNTVIRTDSGIGYGDTISYAGEMPTRSTTETEGYIFDGWAESETGDVVYALRDNITVNGDITLYAHFTLVPMRTVTWYNEDGSAVLATQKALQGASVSYNGIAPTKTGADFAGWSSSVGGSLTLAPSAVVTVNGNMSFYALFETKKFEVVWKNHDGNVLKTETLAYGTMPAYSGTTPVKTSTAEFSYAHTGWTPALAAVTDAAEYTAVFTPVKRSYTITWKNYDNTVLKTESVEYGTTPTYTGEDPVRLESATHTFRFKGWDNEPVPVVGDATYLAVYEEIDKIFTATVKVLENPDIDSVTGAVSGGTPTDLDELTEYDALWLRDVEDHSKLYPMSRKEAGVYTAELLHGSYDVVVKKGEIYDRIITERIVLPAETVAGDPDTTAADIIFFSVTYDFDGGSYDGKNSIVKYYQRGADVIIDDITPAREFYQFNNWQLDSGSDIYFSNQRITVLGMGIIKPHTITARWQRSNDKVIVNLTVNHHSDPAVSLTIGINPAAGLAPIHIDLTGKAAGSDVDYVQAGKSYVLAADWITPENTVDTETPANGLEYNTKISTLSFAADVTDFQGLSSALDYSANIRLEDYFLTDRTITASEPDANGDITYTVNATLQYRPDLFTMHYTVQIDDSVPDVLIPAAVDIKILSYKDGEWSPISRHTNSSFEARFDGTESVSGSYSVPMDYLYRVSVFGFTLADDTELFAENGLIELVDYTSKATSASATYKYAAGAYTAVVTVTSDQTAVDGSKGIYGVADGTGYKQADGVSVLVNVFANAHSVTFDPNGGKLNGSTEALEVENQFRIPVLGSYIPTRDDGYVFDGWQLNDSPAVIGEVITEDVTLIAKWKAPLTVSGEIRISTKDSDGNTILFEGLPISLTVTLERTAPSGDQFIVRSKTYALDESNYTSGVGILAYEFTPVPQDGSSYRIYVNVTNYQTAFMNEPASGSVSASVLNDPANYVGSREALDNNADNAAHVYAYLIFDPEEFPLTWEIDASSIASAYRPESLDMLVRFNSENDVSTSFYDWSIIVQHFDGSTYSPENTVIASDGKAIDSYPVWNVHPQGYAFDYALKLHQWEKGGLKYDLTESTPFNVTFEPAIAWYNGTKQVTTDPLQDNLKVMLSPKSYKINYELNAGSDEVSGMSTAPENHIWSYATEVPTALIRHGYDFLGWTCDVAGAYADGVISADTASDITLTANWSKQKAVTFRIANGTWQGGSAADIVRYVSLTDNSADIRDIIPTGMNAAYGYHNGSWNDAALNAGGTAPIIVSGSDAITYVYSFERQYHNVSFDANGDGIAESIDSVAHGNYIRITPVNGIWQGSSAEQDIRIESDLQLVNPTRANYIFAGWNRHFIDDSASHPGSVVRHNYMAAWLYDENGDNVPDNLQKKVIFNVANGTWDGVNYAPIIKFATLNAENEADISSLVPTGMQPRAGFLAQDAFWSPDVLSNSIVHGNGVVSYTYNHYTTITYADALNEGNAEQLMILPGSYVSIDPAGGVWDESLSATIIQINGAYVLQAPEYTNHDFLGWKISAGTGGVAHVFTAEWKKESYTIIWQNADGTELEKDENVEFGTMPGYDGEAPVKASDAQYRYEFLGWTPAVKPADANAVYKAEYTPVLRSYTVTWLDWEFSHN